MKLSHKNIRSRLVWSIVNANPIHFLVGSYKPKTLAVTIYKSGLWLFPGGVYAKHNGKAFYPPWANPKPEQTGVVSTVDQKPH